MTRAARSTALYCPLERSGSHSHADRTPQGHQYESCLQAVAGRAKSTAHWKLISELGCDDTRRHPLYRRSRRVFSYCTFLISREQLYSRITRIRLQSSASQTLQACSIRCRFCATPQGTYSGPPYACIIASENSVLSCAAFFAA